MITTGDTAPDFTLPGTDGEVTLAALRPAKVVLFFYPKDDTSTCTIEAIDFTTQAEAFAAAGARVFGLSKDSLKSHVKFAGKHALGVALLSDAGSDTCERYGVWVEKTMYGKAYRGIERTTLLIDGSGKVAKAWHKVAIDGHVAEVLATVQAL